MYKLVAIDLDGTLLNSYGQITEKSKNVIQKAVQKGVNVVLTSGRNAMSVQNLATEIGADHYIICGNGAMVYDLQKKQMIYHQFLEKRKILQLVRICEENSIYYSVYTENGIIAKSLNYNVLYYHQENSGKPDSKKTNINIVQNIDAYIRERQEEDYIKMTICDDNQIIFNRMIQNLKKVRDVDVLDVAHMSRKLIKLGTEVYEMEYFYTEISGQNVDKWNAIAHLMDLLSISADEVMAIGDNVNDKTMLQNAGLGVAMENSAPYIKEFADVVTLDNHSDGVAKAIEDYILNAE
ncbi:MAG: HAD family phosphatase [Clostridia bacterium]|nr:HAD family phosphatase [Clostridia bacterium]